MEEFRSVINESRGTSMREKLNEFSENLSLLTQENGYENKQLLEIPNSELLTDIENNFQNNTSLVLRYKRADIQRYLQEMEQGDERTENVALFDKVIFNPQHLNFKYQGKVMNVEKGTGQHIRANLCLLLFGHPALFNASRLNVEMTIKGLTSYTDYEPGDPIDFDVIAKLVLSQGDDEFIIPDGPDRYRSIREAISVLNDRSEKALGIPIFDLTQPLIKICAPL